MQKHLINSVRAQNFTDSEKQLQSFKTMQKNKSVLMSDDQILCASNHKITFQNQYYGNSHQIRDPKPINRKSSDLISMHSQFLPSYNRKKKISTSKVQKTVINKSQNKFKEGSQSKDIIDNYKNIQHYMQMQNTNLKSYNKALLQELENVKKQRDKYKQKIRQKNHQLKITLLQKQAYREQIDELKTMLYQQVSRIQSKYIEEYRLSHPQLQLNQKCSKIHETVTSMNENYYKINSNKMQRPIINEPIYQQSVNNTHKNQQTKQSANIQIQFKQPNNYITQDQDNQTYNNLAALISSNNQCKLDQQIYYR